MAFITVGKENSADIHLYYEDHGSGRPVLLIHGWPLSSSSWERQTHALLAAGYRVIAYDRRGFGKSSQPATGYDYNTLAGDTDKLIDALDLKELAMVGFSMGGGEVARYMGKYNQGRVAKVCFMSSIAPALRKDGNNPEGVDPKVFVEINQKIEKDRFDFLKTFAKMFYNHQLLSSTHTSDALLDVFFTTAALSSYEAMRDCVDAWLEDFREDVRSIKVPAMVIHGDADQTIPLEASGARMPTLLSDGQLHIVEGGPHGLNWTHATEVNRVLLSFLKQ